MSYKVNIRGMASEERPRTEPEMTGAPTTDRVYLLDVAKFP
jgi:hypothetical protein